MRKSPSIRVVSGMITREQRRTKDHLHPSLMRHGNDLFAVRIATLCLEEDKMANYLQSECILSLNKSMSN